MKNASHNPALHHRLRRVVLRFLALLLVVILGLEMNFVTVIGIGTATATEATKDIPRDMSELHVEQSAKFATNMLPLVHSERRRDRDRSRSPGRRRY